MTAPPFLWQRCAVRLYRKASRVSAMNSPGPMPIFDGHNDALLRLWKRGGPGRAARLPRRRRQGTARPADGGPGRLRRRHVRDLRAVAEEPGDDRGQRAAACPAPAPGAPVPPPLDLATAQTAVTSMASILFRIEREANGRVRVCRTADDIRALHRHRRAGRGAAYRGRRGDRPGVRDARCAASGGPALARPGVEPAECVRSRRAVPLSVVARHRAWPDRSRQGAHPRLQPAEHPDRPVASQREGLLGRGRTQRRAARRHAFQRPCAQPAFAQPDRQAARGDPRNRTAWSG